MIFKKMADINPACLLQSNSHDKKKICEIKRTNTIISRFFKPDNKHEQA